MFAFQIEVGDYEAKTYGVKDEGKDEGKVPGDHCEYECVWGGRKFRELFE